MDFFLALFFPSKETRDIIATKDNSCAPGKRGFCKQIEALAYKLV